MSYSNFKDPLGLLKRMLFSRNKVAYSVLKRELYSKVLTPIDFLLANYEKCILKKSRDISDKPIILVLGGSRSGTTLLYQTLAHYLPVSYMSNFIASFQHSPLSALKLFNDHIPKSKKSFKSYFGSVSGLDGPNDAFSLWNRWLGEDRNHIPNDIDQQSKSEMTHFFNAWLNISKKPFLNKNNRNSLCASMLGSIFKNIYFIEIYRDPIFVAQSLILSRRTVQGSDKIGWGVLGKDSKDTDDPLAYIDDICEQVYQVNQIIVSERKKIDSKKYLRVSYEVFCAQPDEVVKKVALEAMNLKIDSKELASLKFSSSSNGQRLKDDEFNRICTYFDNLKEKDIKQTMT